MPQKLVHIAIVVNDYDEAIDYYTNYLGFKLIEDTELSAVKRWVLVSPNAENSCQILLAKAVGDEQKSRIGNQTGGRVFLFLQTDDFWKDYENYTKKGINFIRKPIEETYGIVAVFEDIYGNLWDLIQYK